MLRFRVPEGFSQYTIWEDQLKEWCVAYKIEKNSTLKEPELQEGKEKPVVGAQSIDNFLKEYKAFMDEWYDCRCDKWF